DSQVSGGIFSISQLAGFLDERRIDVGIITDHDHVEVEYGLFPFRKLLTYKISRPSIRTIGINNYLNQIDTMDSSYTNLILLPGVEAVPFYRWTGCIFTRNLTLHDWHRHLLVFGLKNPKDLGNLPSIANNGAKRLSMNAIGMASIYLVLFFLGLKLRKRASVINMPSQKTRSMIRLRVPALHKQRRVRFWGNLIMLAGAFGFVYQLPFQENKNNPYDTVDSPAPYQELIDYVHENQGLVFWAHPEVQSAEYIHGIEAETFPYHQLLLKTQNYTGFAIFWEGMEQIGRPNGIWDLVLNQYCLGTRDQPIWAISELDFGDGNKPDNITESLTMLLVKEKSTAEVLSALRSGRMYATRNFVHRWLRVQEFSVGSRQRAFSGEQIVVDAESTATVKIIIDVQKSSNFMLQLIRNGKIIYIDHRSAAGQWHINFSDAELLNDRKSYYRFLVYENHWPVLASNPIFVLPSGVGFVQPPNDAKHQ
ncbi:hypothetical protein L0Z72_02295, partial [candidate division KSB1 bacterium]|nr:hypothetical protein [candidate division KSB1 bacterium]